MVREFEGKTEKEAIDLAARELGLDRDEFDVEIVEAQKNGFLFKKGKVKIRVHLEDDAGADDDRNSIPRAKLSLEPEAKSDFEKAILDFTSGMIERMGFSAKTSILFREPQKLGIKIDSASSAILIGKKGKNLDALQLLANVYAGKIGREDVRVILDSENYRIRREESLVKLAYATAEKVREGRQSVLLEPMNPFERRLIHTTLNDITDIETKSEGEGLYRQVRVLYRGRS